jgi:hypothetical protein
MLIVATTDSEYQICMATARHFFNVIMLTGELESTFD